MNRARYFFNSLISSIANNGGGIDPISLGQPIVYFQTFDKSYLTPSTPNVGDSITEIFRYSGGSFVASGETGCVGTWENLNGKKMIYLPGVSGGCWPPPCTGSCTTFYETNQDISFMSKTGYSYTMYFVGKPLSGNSQPILNVETGPRGFVLTDLNINQQVLRSHNLYVRNNKDVYLTINVLYQEPAGPATPPLPPPPPPLPSSLVMIDLPIEVNSNESELESKNLRIFSVRAQDTFNTGSTVAYSYVNGIQTTGVTQSLLPTESVDSGYTAFIGGGFDDLPYGEMYQGYFAELIIFDTLHNDTTHTGVVDFLKNRWNIV